MVGAEGMTTEERKSSKFLQSLGPVTKSKPSRVPGNELARVCCHQYRSCYLIVLMFLPRLTAALSPSTRGPPRLHCRICMHDLRGA